MRYFFILLLCTAGLVSTAQTWAPQGSVWNYRHYEGGFGPRPSKMIRWYSDTMTFNGHLCSFLHPDLEPWDDYTSMFLMMATYEEADKVYWFNPVADSFTILYDFTKKPGEYWDITGLRIGGHKTGPECKYRLTVTAVGMDTINGIPLKSMMIEGGIHTFSGKVIQHIGHLQMPRPEPSFLCSSIADLGAYDGLCSIDIPGIGYYDFNKGIPCIDPVSIRDPVIAINCSFVPNPASGFADVNYTILKETSLEISDITGRLLLTRLLDPSQHLYRINTDSWAAGLYIYRLTQPGSAVISGKLLRQ